MCGIAGFWDLRTSATADSLRSKALRMADTLRHRGPDDSGVWLDEAAGIALSHRRLSVVDLSPHGHQPMSSASGRYVIVYNGEIYNFPALRSELKRLGHAFRGHSDTEVVLASITEWGLQQALLRFNGMFAFGLWDREQRRLYLARDRFGEKPLYYGWIGSEFVFGSELKAVRAHPLFRNIIDRNALALYVRYGYVPAPHCIYEHVQQLPPGSWLQLATEPTCSAKTETYWSVMDVARESMQRGFRGSDMDAAQELETLLEDAVRLRLVADVPLGAFLSGGMDSSTVVALMQRQSSRPVKTFTVGFQEAPYNEAEDAKKVASHLGTDHAELYVSPTDAMDVIPRLPILYDEPFADSSQIPTFLISSFARRYVTVSLSGDGGDELLAGYNRYVAASGFTRSLLLSPAFLRRAVGKGLHGISPKAWDIAAGLLGTFSKTLARQRHVGNKLHRMARALVSGERDTYMALMSVWDSPHDVVLGAPGSREATSMTRVAGDHLSETQVMMLRDAATYLPDDILVKVDRASMGVSLETRVPFLDPRVAEFCWALPMSMKVRRGARKWLLLKVLGRHVPRSLINRPKTGFAVPIGSWLRGPLRAWAEELLDETTLHSQGLLDPRVIRAAWATHLSGREDLQDRLWSILMFQSWFEEQRHYSVQHASQLQQ